MDQTNISPLPRHIPLPSDLSTGDLDAMEQAVFFPVAPTRSDLLFVFGYTSDHWDQVAHCWQEGLAPLVLATGLHAVGAVDEEPQAHVIRRSLIAHGVPEKVILMEDQSTNTLENVVFGKRVLDEQGIHPESVLFVAKSHHSGRCARTLKKHFQQAVLSCLCIDWEYDGVLIAQATWREHQLSKERVYAEYLRIQRYSAKGDID